MTALILKAWDELKRLVQWLFRHREKKEKRQRVIRYLAQLSQSQRTALRGTFRQADTPEQPVYWHLEGQGLPCPVLMYLGFFLEEEALTPVKHTPPGTTGYRFAPWFHEYLNRHPEALEARTSEKAA